MAANFFARHALQRVVDVVAAQVRIAVRGKHLIDVAVARGDQFENRNVEGAAAEIVNGDLAALLFVQAISERRGGRFIHQAQDFEAREAAGIARGLPLRVIEIGGHGDDRAVDGVLKIFLGPNLQLAQDERRNFGRREDAIAQAHADYILAAGIDAKREDFQFVLHVGRAAAHQALHGINRPLGLGQADDAARLDRPGSSRPHRR